MALATEPPPPRFLAIHIYVQHTNFLKNTSPSFLRMCFVAYERRAARYYCCASAPPLDTTTAPRLAPRHFVVGRGWPGGRCFVAVFYMGFGVALATESACVHSSRTFLKMCFLRAAGRSAAPRLAPLHSVRSVVVRREGKV